jgi:hypothetical protein
MSFLGQFSFGYPVTTQNIITTIPDDAIIPLSIGSSLQGNVLGTSFADLKSQVSSNSTWGSITGNIYAQNDLINLINQSNGPRYIGEKFGGGVIFYLWKDENNIQHGLITSIVDQSTFVQYSNVYGNIGASTTWNGQLNTSLMAAQAGATSGAWKLCNDYVYNGFTDWYLPSVDQLNLLYNNRFLVNKALATVSGATQLAELDYWSSSQVSAFFNAWTFYFSSGSSFVQDKSINKAVRAIREF